MELIHLSSHEWILAIFCGFLIGFSKTGISGMAALMVPIMAEIFGGKASSGIVLPMLIFGDLIAVNRYRKHAELKYIIKLIPWSAAGIILGIVVGDHVTDAQFKTIIAIIILAGLIIMIWQEKKGIGIPNHWFFAAILGLAGGFSTMIGNAAGAILAIYLLSMRLPKYSYIGTGAWFFMIVNLIKIPLQVIFWKGITLSTLIFNAMMIPSIIIGAFVGIFLVKRINEKAFRYVVIILTAVSAIKLFI